MLLSAAAALAGEPESIGPVAREALTLCQEAERLPPAERADRLQLGLDRAEEAVRVNPQDPGAHFAIFCNVGLRLRSRSGWRLLASFGDLSRARKEVDIALLLAPDYSGALAAKGQMLAELPRWLGGDKQEAERLLRRAVELDRDDPRMNLMLAGVLQAAGRRDEALKHASIAVGILEQRGSPDDLATARTLVASLQ